MKTIFEHSIDEKLLTKGGWVLDAGCGKDFSFGTVCAQNGMKVICVDPNPQIKDIPIVENMTFRPYALSLNNTPLQMSNFNDPDAATVIKSDNDSQKNLIISKCEVKAMSIKQIMEGFHIEQFDVIKMDIEGSEYDILMNIDSPISKQITVEFHDFRNLNPYYPNDGLYYTELMKKIGTWYTRTDDICPKPGWMGSNTKWDVLFRLKKEFIK